LDKISEHTRTLYYNTIPRQTTANWQTGKLANNWQPNKAHTYNKKNAGKE
tara:strand:+ start:563 stop:712 length:150 start_codon:yes stop_codon:yes gene_type:complete